MKLEDTSDGRFLLLAAQGLYRARWPEKQGDGFFPSLLATWDTHFSGWISQAMLSIHQGHPGRTPAWYNAEGLQKYKEQAETWKKFYAQIKSEFEREV
jgi:hypothetical protein